MRYVTALAHGWTRIRYQDVANLKSAQQSHNQGNHKFTWEIAARHGHIGYILITAATTHNISIRIQSRNPIRKRSIDARSGAASGARTHDLLIHNQAF